MASSTIVAKKCYYKSRHYGLVKSFRSNVEEHLQNLAEWANCSLRHCRALESSLILMRDPVNLICDGIDRCLKITSASFSERDEDDIFLSTRVCLFYLVVLLHKIVLILEEIN